jgi:hypothetical protein
VGRRGARPADADFTAPQAEAIGLIHAAIEARDPTPLLLDGVTGGGKTAIYVEAIVAALEAGRPALVLVPEIALAIGAPTHETVFWVMGMRRFGWLAEVKAAPVDGYFQYEPTGRTA